MRPGPLQGSILIRPETLGASKISIGELHGTISGGDLKVCRPRAGYDKLPVIIVGGEGDGRQVGGTKPLGF